MITPQPTVEADCAEARGYPPGKVVRRATTAATPTHFILRRVSRPRRATPPPKISSEYLFLTPVICPLAPFP